MEERSYAARAIVDGAPPVTHAGTLTISASSADFTSDEGHRCSLALTGLTLRVGGAGDKLVFLSHGDHGGVSIVVRDALLLVDPHLLGQATLAAQLERVRSRRRRGWLVFAAILLATALAIALPLSQLHLASAAIARRVPRGWEENLGKAAFTQVRLNTTLLETPEVNAAVDAFVAPLLELPLAGEWEWQFHVAHDAELNAFALPGGIVVLNSGLIFAAENGAEILGVLGHEMGHVHAQHGVRQLIQAAGIGLVATALLGDATGLLATAGAAAPMLLTLRYSRRAERQADDIALDAMAALDLDPAAMATFFRRIEVVQNERLAALGEDGSGVARDVLSWASTHPATADRVVRFGAAAEAASPPFVDTTPRLVALQAAVRAATDHQGAR